MEHTKGKRKSHFYVDRIRFYEPHLSNRKSVSYQFWNNERCDEATRSRINMDMNVPTSLCVLLLELIVQSLNVFVLTSICCPKNGGNQDRIL